MVVGVVGEERVGSSHVMRLAAAAVAAAAAAVAAAVKAGERAERHAARLEPARDAGACAGGGGWG